jgi:TolB-like protein/Flp pilus assembly protein TadD
VNVAVRLEALAKPGGICVSASVREYAQHQVNINFEYAGEQQLKNIASPVRIYRVRFDPAGKTGRAPTFLQKQDEPAPPRLSILVLPFANLNNDPKQEHLADGITDDLITDLTQWPDSFVIARSTAFSYKERAAVDAKQIGRELRVRYILEGSVRRSGKRIRVGVQLVDVESGTHLWADRFDRDLSELLEMQDEITGRIGLALHYNLTDAESRRCRVGGSNEPEAIDLEFRGQAALYKTPSKATLAEARAFFESALKIDNRSTRAWAGLSLTHAGDVLGRWSGAPDEQLRAAEEAAAKALASNPTSPNAHLARAGVLFAQMKLEASLDEYAKVIELGRNWPSAYARIGLLNALLGRPEETFRFVEKAIRLSPCDSSLGEWYLNIGVARFMMDQIEEAIIWLRRATEANPEIALSFLTLASACSLVGRREEARAALSQYLSLHPRLTVSRVRRTRYSNHPAYLAWLERYYEGLRQAGLPE